MNRRIFMQEQENLDMGWGCINEGHTWEALLAAIDRMNNFIGYKTTIPVGKYNGIKITHM